MEITIFEIMNWEIVNPSNLTIPFIVTALSLLFIFGSCVLAFGPFRMSEYKTSTRVLIIITGLGQAASTFVLGQKFETHYTPQNQESHVTCRYDLKNANEQIEYFTLIPRSNGIFCSKIGTKVTRVKTPEYTKFFIDFEIPR